MEYTGYISDKGTLIFPKDLVTHLGLHPGEKVSVSPLRNGGYAIFPSPTQQTPKKKTILDFLGTIKINGPLDVKASIQQAVLDNDQY